MKNQFASLTPQSIGCMFIASLGALLFGFDNGWWGTILGSPRFLRDYGSCAMVAGVEVCNLSTAQMSAGSSVQSGGIMVGCAIAAYLNNLLGRRRALMITALVSIVGVVIEVTSSVGGGSARFTQFVVGKVIASISMGLVVNVIPVYLSETSPASARGLGISIYQNVQIIGVITASGVVYGSSTMDHPAAYLIPMGLQLIAPGLMLALTPFMPESPRWLVLNGREDEARLAAKKLLGGDDDSAHEYCAKIHLAYEQEQIVSGQSSWMDLTRNPDLRRMLIAVGIQSLQQAQGSSYMNSYIVPFLQGTGVVNVFPVIMGLYVVYYVAIVVGGFLADIAGRRALMIWSGTFCAIALLAIAIITTVITTPNSATQQASIALIFLWEFSFGVQSPIVWIITTESAPTTNREKVLAVATFFGFGVSLLITSVSPYIQNADYGNLGSKIGFIWGSFSVVTVFWVWVSVPEMKGFSLEQLDHLFIQDVPTRAFRTYKFADDLVPIDLGAEEAGATPSRRLSEDDKAEAAVEVRPLDKA